jgi:hypothetical protein
MLDLLDIRQVELQLTTTPSTMCNYNHDNTLNASSFLLVCKLTDSSSGTDPETGFIGISSEYYQSHFI